jgi:CubicO group peptidase (beta-lactamase class C family)
MRIALGAILLAVAPFASAPLAAQSFSTDAFDAYVRQAFTDWNAVGLAVAVVKDGELVFAEGYGELELGSGEQVNAETRFSIGSTTKAMTAGAIGMLVDEGKVAWDDPVIEHLPWFQLSDPWMTREITIRDLLTHRAGLGNTDFLWYEHDVSREWVVEQVRHAELAYSPRTSFIYQNIMYATAGLVVEAVSGMRWADFIDERIFEPLGMTETFSLLSETTGQPNVARPHYTVDGERMVIENASVDPVDAAGSVWSSVEDMSRWLRMLLNGGVAADGTRILSEAVVEEMFTPQTMVTPSQFYPTQQITHPNWMTYGLAWFQHDFRGQKLDFHTGSIDGMVAIAGLVRDQNVGVYVLGNRDHVEVRHALMYRALDHFLAPDESTMRSRRRGRRQSRPVRSRAARARHLLIRWRRTPARMRARCTDRSLWRCAVARSTSIGARVCRARRRTGTTTPSSSSGRRAGAETRSLPSTSARRVRSVQSR